MALDFPNAPTVGQKFTTGDRDWIWTGSRWDAAGGVSNATFTASDTAPVGPNPGDQWFDTNTGRLYVWYDSFWVETTGAPAITDASLLTGTTMAANVVNYPSHTVQRQAAAGFPANDGGEIALAGGTSFPSALSIDRFDDTFRVLAPAGPGGVSLQVGADIDVRPGASGRVKLGGRSGYLPLGQTTSVLGSSVGPVGTGEVYLWGIGAAPRFTMAVGDIVCVTQVVSINVNTAGPFVNLFGRVFYNGAFESWAPDSALMGMGAVGTYVTGTFVSYYTATKAGLFDFCASMRCDFGGTCNVNAGYTRTMAEHWGIR